MSSSDTHSATASSSETSSARAPLDRRIKALAGVIILGAVAPVLDATAVNVSLAVLGRDLHTSVASVQWVMTGYLLALALIVPVTGWATDRLGAKRLWMLSLALFVIGSTLSGLAWSIGSLIVFRVLQGLGGGMIAPLAQTILSRAAGPQRMGRVMSLLAVVTVLGPVVGPVLGGFLVQSLSWRWIFFINIPVGLLAMASAARWLPRVENRQSGQLDVLGLVLASVGLAALIYGLSRAGSAGGFGALGAYGPIFAGVLLLVAFVPHSLRRRPTALVDVRLFTNRGFGSASVALFLIGMVLFGVLLLLPLYYQAVRGESAFTTGLLLAPQGVGAALMLPLAGKLTDRLGARVAAVPGIILILVGTLTYTQVTAHTSYALLTAALVARGMGLGLVLSPITAAAYVLLPSHALAQASSLATVIRRIGGSVGTALLAVILARNIPHDVTASGGHRSLGTLGAAATSQSHIVPLADAFGHAFWIALAVTALALLPALFLPPATGSEDF
jgi:EmrB/QacA subfamily drug resistance transporter